tara:strand:+ start:2128 stop:2970 length:843 start_codon:yes stop_codon:yes gene_type:complete
MSKGYLIIASGKDYVTQACMCAMSIKHTQEINNISIVTNDKVPKKYQSLFDKIIDIPWIVEGDDTYYLTEQRWKAFHVTPYEETVVLDTDMVFLDDVSRWWKILNNFDVFLTTKVFTYRKQKVTSDFYRKAFVENKLPNFYCGFHYFKQNDIALDYYKDLEKICHKHTDYYKKFVPKAKPQTTNSKGETFILSSMDINHSIATLHGHFEQLSNDAIYFTHMKSKVQNVDNIGLNWTDSIPFYMTDDLELKVGNFLQQGIFHYTENKFCKDVIKKYESKVL